MENRASKSNTTEDLSMDFESFVAAGPAHPVIFGHPKDSEYSCSYPNRGKCIIFNHRVFKAGTGLLPREATEHDVQRLIKVFGELKFEVIRYDDLSADAIERELKKVSKEDHTSNMCMVCCVLTHGSSGELWAADAKYSVESVLEPFHGDTCLSLAGKPKIFFIQACQGDKSDWGEKISFQDSPDMALSERKRHSTLRIPVVSDFLIAYAAFPGFLSFRNKENGSYFIIELCNALHKYGKDKDLLWILTKVNKRMAGFSSDNPGNPAKHRKKQAPSFHSSLTRLVKFR